METILDQLNDSQRAAVEYCDGPSLVIAGAGSGKTRVLTYKIAYLLQSGIKPWNILALTFTNKAAREMKERVAELVGVDDARHLYMGTFHSVFSRILRAEAEKIGYRANYTIYDQSDSTTLIRNIIKEMRLDDKTYQANSVYSRVCRAKDRLVLPAAYAADKAYFEEDKRRGTPAIKEIYRRYAERCRVANAMDFDDLLVNTYVLFRDHEDVKEKYASRFLYVLVDEYQDTNYAQQVIIMQLSGAHGHVCVVGDDAQSIYAFRGADINNILRFGNAFDDARLFKLERNYRSTRTIVKAANSLIQHNKRQIPKNVYSKNDEGERLTLKRLYTDKEEALFVCTSIEQIKNTDACRYKDFAVLYRTNAQSRIFEEYMRKSGIPYKLYGGVSFYQRKEIKDILAYFRLFANPDDDEAFRRVINYPTRGIGGKTLDKLAHIAAEKGVSMMTVVRDIESHSVGIAKTVKRIVGFRNLLDCLLRDDSDKDAYTTGKDIISRSGIRADIAEGNGVEDIARRENVEEFLSTLWSFVQEKSETGDNEHNRISDFLREIELLTDHDNDDGDDDRVSLMTVHSAKGLEFGTVFIVGLEENIFPSQISAGDPRELEEERRLLYVAITRAKRHCILSYAETRFRYGHIEYGRPSRFINDIDPATITGKPTRLSNGNGVRMKVTYNDDIYGDTAWGGGQAMQKSPNHKRHLVPALHATNGTPPPPGADVSVGSVIMHNRFGRGTVTMIEGTGENIKATVAFDNAGTKQLLLKFAKYTVMSKDDDTL